MAATAGSGSRLFKDDDGAYVRWLEEHPRGYVLNCQRSPRATYLVLHRAACGTITGVPARGGRWTDQFIKVCSESAEPIRDWTRARVRAEPRPCGLCHP